jgi:hypothetical protein
LRKNPVPVDVTVLKSKAIVKFMNTHIPKDKEAKINFVNVEFDHQEINVELGENFRDYGFSEAKYPFEISSQSRPTNKENGKMDDISLSVNGDELGLSNLLEIKNYEGDVTVNLKGTDINAKISDGVEYTIVQTESGDYVTFTDIKARDVSIIWQFIYVLMTVAELNITITVLTFTITQSPTHLKSLGCAIMSALMCLGNAVVVILTRIGKRFELNRYETFLVSTGLCLFALFYFSWTGRNYEYTNRKQIQDLSEKIKQAEEEENIEGKLKHKV